MTSCILGLTSCTLDINQNPNAISNASNDDVFPTAEMNLAATVAVGFNMNGGYNAEIYAQNAGCSNYLKYSQFEVTATNTAGSYTQLYTRILQQLQVVLNQSENLPNNVLAATALRAYTYQLLVDAYGETPYSEALTTITQPKYDDGADVYAGIIKELEDAKSKVNDKDLVCKNILFGKRTATTTKVDEWVKFANTVLLKLYMRESKVVDNKAKIAALIAEDNFITEDVVYNKCWDDSEGSYSPLFAESKTIANDLTLNYGITATVKSEGVNDLRLYANWKDGNKGLIGGVSGSNLSSEMSGTNGVDDVSAAVTSEAYPYDSTNPMKNIGIQKWIHYASALMGFEGWCELRRIGYPAFSDQKAEDIITNDVSKFNAVPQYYEVGTLYTPKSVFNEVGAKKLRQRFDYSESSTQYNKNVPATKAPTEPIFWNK